jgi:prepilin-type N-terminal cleavage/methylation domain-containing protein
MTMSMKNKKSGFTLLELMVAMALSLLVVGAMASLFKTGMSSTFVVAQRAETQQNMRAAIDLMVKDINMAGAGLPSGGLQLPIGAGNNGPAKFGCDQAGACHVPANTYPNNNYMYGIIPGFRNGVENNSVITQAPAPAINDSITVAYCDYNFPLWEYNGQFPVGGNVGSITMTANAIYNPAPPALNAAGGLQVGDLVFFPAGPAVAEVTGVTANTITFNDLDPLNMNQSGAATNQLKTVSNANPIGGPTSAIAYRMFVVTYYLNVPAAGQLPRLMRQVNGLSPVPVADGIVNLQFAYDTYNSTGNALDANQPDPLGVGESPNLIQKANLIVMGESLTQDGNKSQSMYLATSVSARNMAFRNRYQ